MEKRIRSPNYPALSLPDAVERVTTLYRNQHNHAAPREVAVKSMGYNTLNGASATALSALHKYGLLDRLGSDGVKVSERALRIMHPNSPGERRQALIDAANEPSLFAELKERFPGRLPSDEVLRNYLIRKNFAPAATSAVLLAYRKTIEFVEGAGAGYDSGSESTEEAPMMTAIHSDSAPGRGREVQSVTETDERRIGVIDLPDGSYVRIMASPDVDPEEALEWAEEIIALQRRVIAKRRGGAASGKHPANASLTNDSNKANENA